MVSVAVAAKIERKFLIANEWLYRGGLATETPAHPSQEFRFYDCTILPGVSGGMGSQADRNGKRTDGGAVGMGHEVSVMRSVCRTCEDEAAAKQLILL